MNKKYSFLFAILITILIFSNWYIFKSHSSLSERETAIVGRVIDGDTLVLEDGRTIRLLNINTPEKSEAGNELGADYLKSFENKSIDLEFTGIDKYQRNLARIYSYSSDYINLKLVELGYAKKFLVDEGELKQFSIAEKQAIENSLGIWKKSAYFGCFKADINEKEEIVQLTNTCADISLSGWQIKDESRKIYTFGNLNLINSENIIINSGEGVDNEKEVFWDAGNVWNNDRDTLYLFDKENKIALYSPYGY